MKRVLLVATLLVAVLAVAVPTPATTQSAQSPASTDAGPPATVTVADGPGPAMVHIDHAQDAPYYEACARQGLNESECAGRLIWFKATAGNERFHTYVFQQRVGVLIDWFRVLRADQ
ncbi:MAG: cytochrome c, partial [Azoarcus sp.]|nr:cytochrome c [Azoarcus sp.]